MSAAQVKMLPKERRSVSGLATVFGLRLLGMYLVLPTLALYVSKMEGATPQLIGLSVGVYGLAQGLLQVPMGALGDRFGRRRVISAGLVVFAAGSVVAAMADTAWMLVLGRLIQGAGAITSTLVALVADLTRPQVRARGMASVGSAVAISFGVGMVAGPALSARFGTPSLFWLMAAMALIGAVYVLVGVPKAEHTAEHEETEWHQRDLKDLLRSLTMLRLNFGIFCLQAMATGLFVVGPRLMEMHIHPSKHGLVYIGLIPFAFFLMIYGSRRADRTGRLRESVLAAAVLVLGSSALLFSGPEILWRVIASIFLTVGAVALAEPAMPAMLSRLSPPKARGTAAGLFHSCEFIGSFFGAYVAGIVYEQPEKLGFIFMILALVWFVAAWGLPHLAAHGSHKQVSAT